MSTGLTHGGLEIAAVEEGFRWVKGLSGECSRGEIGLGRRSFLDDGCVSAVSGSGVIAEIDGREFPTDDGVLPSSGEPSSGFAIRRPPRDWERLRSPSIVRMSIQMQ